MRTHPEEEQLVIVRVVREAAPDVAHRLVQGERRIPARRCVGAVQGEVDGQSAARGVHCVGGGVVGGACEQRHRTECQPARHHETQGMTTSGPRQGPAFSCLGMDHQHKVL